MRILDLDMDYFMTKISNESAESSSGRLEEEVFSDSVWAKEEVINFLEQNLGLSKERKIPGRIVKGHNESLFFWKELIHEGMLFTPFEVIHVDSHADLGLGTDTTTFISEELLRWPVAERPNHSGHFDCFNNYREEGIEDYLLFAIAYQWINKLTYCGNPTETPNDYCIEIMKNFKESAIKDKPVENTIQLLYNPTMRCPQKYLDEDEDIESYIAASQKEPEVPFCIIPKIEDVRYNGDFDFLVLAQSPNYTPANADYIIDVFREYVEEM